MNTNKTSRPRNGSPSVPQWLLASARSLGYIAGWYSSPEAKVRYTFYPRLASRRDRRLKAAYIQAYLQGRSAGSR